jgi:hypothetical protein
MMSTAGGGTEEEEGRFADGRGLCNKYHRHAGALREAIDAREEDGSTQLVDEAAVEEDRRWRWR